jgi:hypothetical protein
VEKGNVNIFLIISGTFPGILALGGSAAMEAWVTTNRDQSTRIEGGIPRDAMATT